MTLVDGFGLVEFQAVLLRRMADYQPALVEQARTRLGLTRTQMRAANAHWQRLTRSPRAARGLPRYRHVLGPPAAEREVTVGDLRCVALQWSLPLWPRLRFEAVALAARGPELHAWLVRGPDEPAPRLREAADLTPWSCVVGDVERAFGSVVHREGDAPSRWRSEVVTRGPDGGPVRLLATFTHGLLQTTSPVSERR